MSEERAKYRIDSPWVPEGMRLPEVGDKVLFRMGERQDYQCSRCGFNHSDPDGMNGVVGTVEEVFDWDAALMQCGNCGLISPTPEWFAPFRYGVDFDEKFVDESGNTWASVTAAAIELEPLDAPAVPEGRIR